MNLQTPISEVDRIFKMYAGRLAKLGIFTIEDLLYYVPFRYDNFTLISKIALLQPGEVVTVQGRVLEIKNQYTRSHKTLQRALLVDDTGELELLWFNQPFLTKSIHPGDTLSVSAKVEKKLKTVSMTSPEHEVIYEHTPSLHTGRFVPIYSETKGVSSKWLRKQVHKMLERHKDEITEFLPDEIRRRYQLMPQDIALQTVHFPQSLADAKLARERLAFDELFLLQLKALQRKQAWKEKTVGIPFKVEKYQTEIDKFVSSLPFTLTNSQSKSVAQILQDLSHNQPMNRLLQGDVGSGKTVVSAVAMYLAYLNDYQSVLMAPTEILAQQHFATISKLLEPFGVKVSLVTGSKRIKNQDLRIKNKKDRNSKFVIHNSSANKQFDVLVGTHAVLSEHVTFEKLGLVVIDEQQRFGVEQRSVIREKGKNPHLLTMTATPIPRTVALTMYGDLDLSYLDEMPKGRVTIKTWLVPPEKRDPGYEWIRKQLKETDSQAFIICPFIEESESMSTVKAATKEYERLKKEVFPHLKLGLLHGRLKGKEKDAVLTDFRNRKYDILVATPVVEVGIDIPNVTIIVIEAADRFGLAQLHQLRGRVGRGEKQSYCLLFTESPSETVNKRLKAMETMHIGAELAELDLKLRGPGDIFGTMQHGLPQLRVANFSDTELIEKAREAAERTFPELSKHESLVNKLQSIFIQKVSPD